jgi:hypothetical protein
MVLISVNLIYYLLQFALLMFCECHLMQVWLPGNMVWDGQALQHRSPLPLPANCGLTAAAAGTIRRDGVAQVPIAE